MNQWKFKCTDVIQKTDDNGKKSYLGNFSVINGSDQGTFSLTGEVLTIETLKPDLFVVGQEYELTVKNIGAARAVA